MYVCTRRLSAQCQVVSLRREDFLLLLAGDPITIPKRLLLESIVGAAILESGDFSTWKNESSSSSSSFSLWLPTWKLLSIQTPWETLVSSRVLFSAWPQLIPVSKFSWAAKAPLEAWITWIIQDSWEEKSSAARIQLLMICSHKLWFESKTDI